jgi:hypothetical protein
MTMFCPSTYPRSRSACRNASCLGRGNGGYTGLGSRVYDCRKFGS